MASEKQISNLRTYKFFRTLKMEISAILRDNSVHFNGA